ncbi:MAG: PKD domain-containing protein [Planctomycetes bacterium]|nr:PKD domain-containing protein [Planctomycetota bacterium]
MRSPLFLLASLCSMSLCLDAQGTIHVPVGTQLVDGNNASPYPFQFTNATGLRVQYLYDAPQFTVQGVSSAVRLTSLRFRSQANFTCAGGSYPNVGIRMSTSPRDHLAATTNFANNHGQDLTVVYSGPVVVNPVPSQSNPGSWFVDIPLQTPFDYNPNLGDLVLELDHDGSFVGVDSCPLDSQLLTGNGCVRLVSQTSRTATTGSLLLGNSVVVEFPWQPVDLYAGFTATPTAGTTPLLVQFTDQSQSSDPAGITSYAWDFDGDQVIDSTSQHPSWNYQTCGTYDVSLTVQDTLHGSRTMVRQAFVRVGTDTVASFTHSQLGLGVYLFTDTTNPAATSWAWDFDADGVVDSTLQNPVWAFPSSCLGTRVQLHVMRDCRGPFSTFQDLALAPATLTAASVVNFVLTSTSEVGNLLDVRVHNPSGINLCALSVRPYGFSGPFQLSVYVTEGSYVGRHATPSAWRLVGQGSGISLGVFNTTGPNSLVSLQDYVYLPQGDYGLAFYLHNPAGSSRIAFASGPLGPFANADLTLNPNPTAAPGISSNGLFGSSFTDNRVWTGALHYSRATDSGYAGHGFLGLGCPGSLGTPTLSASGRPQLGTSLGVTADHLPASAAIVLTGFSRTTSVFGPLPHNLAPYGAPGCWGMVSSEATQFVFGSNNTASWNFTVPNDPGLLWLQVYQQALVLDPGFNPLGAVVSDAAGLLIGM